MRFVAFHGRGLHSGARCSVQLERSPGPVRFVRGEREASVAELGVVRTDRGVCVSAPELGLEIDLVEHLLASLAGVGVRSGIAVRVSGGEIPLLDGGALELSRAVLALEPPRGAPALRIAQDAEIELGASRYVFRRADALELEVEVDFSELGLGSETARWSGSARDFIERIAPARTFGFRQESEALRSSGRAAWVDPHVVLVFEPDGSVAPPARPPADCELARHKLLDLLGDLYLLGGPPIGRLSARRPGHSANRRALAQALERGIVVRSRELEPDPSRG